MEPSRIACYSAKCEGKWDVDAWEMSMVMVTPKVITKHSFKEAYRLGRIIAKAFINGADAIIPIRTRLAAKLK